MSPVSSSRPPCAFDQQHAGAVVVACAASVGQHRAAGSARGNARRPSPTLCPATHCAHRQRHARRLAAIAHRHADTRARRRRAPPAWSLSPWLTISMSSAVDAQRMQRRQHRGLAEVETRTDSARRHRTPARARACARAPRGPARRRCTTASNAPSRSGIARRPQQRQEQQQAERARRHAARQRTATARRASPAQQRPRRDSGRYQCAPGQRRHALQQPPLRVRDPRRPRPAPAWPAPGTLSRPSMPSRHSGTITKLTNGTAIRFDSAPTSEASPKNHTVSGSSATVITSWPTAELAQEAAQPALPARSGTASGTRRRRTTARIPPTAPPADRRAGSRQRQRQRLRRRCSARRPQRVSATTAIISSVRTVGRLPPASTP